MENQYYNQKTKIAVISGIAFGLGLGLFLLLQKRKKTKNALLNYPKHSLSKFKQQKSQKARRKLGQVIEDVQFHIRQNAAGLLS